MFQTVGARIALVRGRIDRDPRSGSRVFEIRVAPIMRPSGFAGGVFDIEGRSFAGHDLKSC